MGKRYLLFIAIVVLLVTLAGCETEEKKPTPTIDLQQQLIQKLIDDSEAEKYNTENKTIEDEILTRYLASWAGGNTKTLVVNPQTIEGFMIDVDKPYTMEYLSEWASYTKDGDIFALVEKFNELNKNPSLLAIKSSITDGYYINYDDKLWKYMAELCGGYYQTENNVMVVCEYFDFTRFHDQMEVSAPAYDEDTGYVLIYSYWHNRVEGRGILSLMKYENGNLKSLYSKQLTSAIIDWVDVEPTKK